VNRKSILYLMLMIILCFSTAVAAGQNVLWPDNAGFDPLTGEGWVRNEGTLAGWSDSNFETLEYKAQGTSEVVGIGVTVEGIDLDWEYPHNLGKGEDTGQAFDQRIDYTVVAFAEIPCVLTMNVFGNGSWVEAISVGDGSHVAFDLPSEEGSHLMLFHPRLGGIVDSGWNFMADLGADAYTDSAVGKYLHACDLWTAEVWSNVPYGFTVSSEGLSNGEQVLDLEMRFLQTAIPIGEPDNGNEIPLEEIDLIGWSADFVLNAHPQGVEIGQFTAGFRAHVNMQFRVPLIGTLGGIYGGEVCFSSYTI